MSKILKSLLAVVLTGVFFVSSNVPVYALGWFKDKESESENAEVAPELTDEQLEKEAKKAQRKAEEAELEAKKKAKEAGEEVNKAAVSATQAVQ